MKTAKIFSLLLALFLLSFPALPKEAPSDIKITVLPGRIFQGQCFWVKVSPSKEIKSLTGEAFGRQVLFFPYGVALRAIIPVPANAAPGKYKLDLTVELVNGKKSVKTEHVLVNKAKFESVSFWLKPSKMGLLSAEVIEEEWAGIEKEITRSTIKQLWEGPFLRPTSGIVSMKFGTHQRINGVPSGQHRGLDIAGENYYRIRAGNYGQVVFADRTRTFGNVVAINHGQGVFSLYLHMSKILVKRGDVVWRGQQVGLMGATGFASGVHLHFAMSVDNVRVDPAQWLYGEVGR